MNSECIDLSALPGTSGLFRDYADVRSSDHAAELRRWYPADPFTMDWAKPAADGPGAPEENDGHRSRLAEALKLQAESFGAGAATLANIEKLRNGAAAVVTGQQVTLFGGPLLTLLKAATAIRKAQDATRASGREHVPVFWLASEDHDVEEVDQVFLLSKNAVERNGANLRVDSKAVPVGTIATGGFVEPTLEWAQELLAFAPICDVLRECYTDHEGYEATLGGAFARLMTRVFAEEGLIVMDAGSREFHALGAPVLQAAIERAGELEEALLRRSKDLEEAGYHAQVKVAADMSLLFLITADAHGLQTRQALRRTADDAWKAGSHLYSTEELLAILAADPERLSPNALLRPVFQDAILPTAAYVGGPAEIAYFAQSAVVYEKILGRVTPVLPRLSATLIEPAIAKTMAAQEVSLPQVWEAKTTDALALQLGERALPVEGKKKLAAAGTAMDTELTALTEYMSSMSADLGRASEVSASKMRYQMDRLRRMAADFEVQKEASLKKQAKAISLSLFPDAHLQERLLAGIWFLARYGETLPELLVQNAGQECPGHRIIYL